MLIFFTVAFTVYFLVNFYIFIKGYRIIPAENHLRLYYTITFVVLGSAFIAGKFIERNHSSVFSDILNILGGFWLALMLYGFLILLISDITYPVLRITGSLSPENAAAYRKWVFTGMIVVTGILIIAGFINALVPKVTRYNITIDKNAGAIKNYRIAAVSDIHLGSIIRKRSIRKLSGLLAREKPDAIFLLGDIVDGEIGPVLRGDLLSYFNCPKCSDGVYAITGNHEYIGGASVTIPYIESKGIRLLRDEVVSLEGEIQVVGRIDRDGSRFGKSGRMPLDSLMIDIDRTKPVIILDHQPMGLDEAVISGADLQLSGHTHDGQVWPLNYVTKGIYEVSNGYLKKGNTQFIVSSGYGIWGPRIRLGSRSEILIIDIAFRTN